MLPAPHRLHAQTDIHAALRGRRLSSPSLTVYWRRTALPVCRVGFLVSKKVSRQAVGRNLLKRRLRAATARLLPQLPPGYDVLIVARTRAAQATFQQLAEELDRSLAQARLLSP